jgi:hypothetical protein
MYRGERGVMAIVQLNEHRFGCMHQYCRSLSNKKNDAHAQTVCHLEGVDLLDSATCLGASGGNDP